MAIGPLANLLAQTTGKSKKLCEDFLREFFRVVSEALQEGETVKIKGFGTFKLSEVESRSSVNVNTGEPYEIASYKKVVFTPAKELASAINAPFEEFQSVEMDDEMTEDDFEQNELATEINEESEERLSDENSVNDERLEQGSDEEGEDDEITLEAYNDIKTIEGETILPVIPPSEENYDIEKNLQEEKEMEDRSERYEPERKSRFGIGFLVGALSTLVVCVVIFMLGCFFDWWPVNFGSSKEEVPSEQVTSMNTTVENEEIPEEIPEPEPVYDTVSTTRYLTTIARDHYGNFNFWPYIYIENESILGHPDRITPGTQVVVPDLSKYGIDPSNKEDVEKAKKKALEIYSRFK